MMVINWAVSCVMRKLKRPAGAGGSCPASLWVQVSIYVLMHTYAYALYDDDVCLTSLHPPPPRPTYHHCRNFAPPLLPIVETPQG